MDIFTIAFALLGCVTVVIAVGALVVWNECKLPHFVLGMFFVYYYSLFGAWSVVNTKMTGGPSVLDHLEEALFPVTIDANYLLSIEIYAVFILTILVMLRILLVRATPDLIRGYPAHGLAVWSHGRLVAISAVSLLLSGALIAKAVGSAFEAGASAYTLTRGEADQFWTIHQLLNRVGLATVTIGLGIYAVQPQRKRRWLFAYALIGASWVAFLGVLGNRNELLVAGIAGVLWYYSLGGRFKLGPIISVAVVGYIVLRSIEFTRGLGAAALSMSLEDLLTSGDFWNPFALAGSSESLAAQMSLYGILARHFDLTYGSSVLYFINSLVPRVINSERIADSYTIYANAVGAPDNQGFNIHYAAGWYLNFGLPGVLLGAVILAVIWAAPIRFLSRKSSISASNRLGFLCAFCYCSAFVPTLMRNGPEGLKSLLVEGLLLPYCLARVAARSVSGRTVASQSISTF